MVYVRPTIVLNAACAVSRAVCSKPRFQANDFSTFPEAHTAGLKCLTISVMTTDAVEEYLPLWGVALIMILTKIESLESQDNFTCKYQSMYKATLWYKPFNSITNHNEVLGMYKECIDINFRCMTLPLVSWLKQVWLWQYNKYMDAIQEIEESRKAIA